MKKWEDYSKEEQTNNLIHWFHYYGGMIYTFKELEDFEKLAKTRQDDIFNYIVTSYIVMNTIQSNVLLMSMRQNKVENLFKASITKEVLKEEHLQFYEEVRDIIVKEIIKEDTTEKKREEKNTQLIKGSKPNKNTVE